VVRAYEEQCAAIEKLGGRIVLMASRALAAAAARSPDDYANVYRRVLSQVREPVIIHWLGDMFDPALAGYWGHADLKAAMDVCLTVLADNAEKIDGVKISLLSGEHEIVMRRRLPGGMRDVRGGPRLHQHRRAGGRAVGTARRRGWNRARRLSCLVGSAA
jgi:hypothetical protein